jgi:hypothetical protein
MISMCAAGNGTRFESPARFEWFVKEGTQPIARQLPVWGGALSKAADQYKQVWEQVTLQGRSAEEAAKEYAPKIQEAFDSIHAKN